jgi:hypothetical protein
MANFGFFFVESSRETDSSTPDNENDPPLNPETWNF